METAADLFIASTAGGGSVCVCVREREREREINTHELCIFLSRLCGCVMLDVSCQM